MIPNPRRVNGHFKGEGGSKVYFLKESIILNWNFQRVAKKPSAGEGAWILNGTAQYCKLYH